ncbi:MAG: APC family permease [Bacteroidetes bacterium]|nr:APC family permease [Bacteroidota bacterium]MBU1372269.1 APC family permease [Bacteroidota bacterium]MBU1486032.1 APC family permease [Bacteroidota bacterium]MBU1759804.1 APC family permease [Bacteroidota bacterium]MBU2045096.1 APC family permease [Bacteroidota bacterium]
MGKDKKLSLLEIISMAVGTMVGASIFSIFGLGAKIAGNDLPEAFILSGIYALAVAYSYAKLGGKIISNAGPIAFILKGLGDSVITGALSILLWLSYVISISLFVKGFAGYLLPFIHIPTTTWTVSLVEIVLISFFTALNFFGSKAVGKVEFYIVFLKLTILLLFIVGGLMTIDWGMTKPNFDAAHTSGLLNASIIFFLSYMGFGLIINSSENIKNPQKNVPLAIYISIVFVLIFYILISLVTIGNLPLADIIKAQENALAIAAKPFLGNFGFILITIGALFSISSALNATIFGGANIAYSLAKDGELPQFFERKTWFKSTEGLYITAGLGLAFALLFDLGAIASLTSTIFTIIYIFVLISHFRLRKTYGGSGILIIINLTILVVVFGALMRYQWNTQRSAFYATIISLVAAILIEYVYRKYKNRKMKMKEHKA